jgi:GntR family transcriptional repressor for pyruvate dehydrogenase complex
MTLQNARGNAPAARPNLVSRVSTDLRALVLSGEWQPGDKLPSEAALTDRFGVSRTVVREAIASLRADGLVETRQGAGVFVLTPPAVDAPSTPFSDINSARISSIIEILELRTAVEIEAAALAAERRSPAQEEKIIELYDDINGLSASSLVTTDADFAFHCAIADATNNPRFREFLELMGQSIIPRAQLANDTRPAETVPYIAQIQAEHRRIVEAISERDAEGAREAMRTHLMGSQQRYRRLLRSS